MIASFFLFILLNSQNRVRCEFSILSHSKPYILLASSTPLTLFCRTNEPFDFCQWSNEDQLDCTVFSRNYLNDESILECSSTLNWNLNSSTCGIRVKEITKEGSYKCVVGKFDRKLGVLSDSFETVISFAISAQASLSINDKTTKVVSLREGESLTIECQGIGGQPNVYEITLASDLYIESVRDTKYGSKVFTAQSNRSNDNSVLVCIVEQYHENHLIFSSRDTKHLEVLFEPRLLDPIMNTTVIYEKENETLLLSVFFESNNKPSVLWSSNLNTNVIETHNDSDVILQSSESNSRLFVSNLIPGERHQFTAILTLTTVSNETILFNCSSSFKSLTKVFYLVHSSLESEKGEFLEKHGFESRWTPWTTWLLGTLLSLIILSLGLLFWLKLSLRLCFKNNYETVVLESKKTLVVDKDPINK